MSAPSFARVADHGDAIVSDVSDSERLKEMQEQIVVLQRTLNQVVDFVNTLQGGLQQVAKQPGLAAMMLRSNPAMQAIMEG